MSVQQQPNTYSKRDVSSILSLIPEEHRLLGLLFILVQAFFSVVVIGNDSFVRIAGIAGMVIFGSVFLIRFFPARRESARDRKSSKEMKILGVNDLANSVLEVLEEKRGRSGIFSARRIQNINKRRSSQITKPASMSR